jgi:CHAT domain-containing protein
LSAETLALLAAGTLHGTERAAAESHLAECRDCYEVLMDLAAEPAAAADAPQTGNIIVWSRASKIIVWSRTRKIIVWSGIAASLLVAAALSMKFLGGPDRQITTAVTTLARAVGPERPSMGRLNGGFEYGAAPAITRGTVRVDLPLAVQDAVLTIRKLAATSKTARSLDAVGVANLVSGDIQASLDALDEAVTLDPADARVRADLAAARLEKWRRSQAPVDATSALDAAEHALLIAPNDPVSRFNHALAVEALGMVGAAKASWQAYLTLDATSKWADEARAHLTRLDGEKPGAGLPTDTGRDRYLPDLTAALGTATANSRQAQCLARGRQAIEDSRAAFDASKTVDAERLALAARAAFVCGGVPTFEADAQIVWTHYFLGTASEAPALARLAADARQHGYLRASGRVQYARGRLADNAGRYSDAQAFFGDALNAFEQAGDLELIASTSVQMAEITRDFGDDAGTWSLLSTAIRALPALAPRRQHMTLVSASYTSNQFGLDGASRFFADALVAADLTNSTDAVLRTGAYLRSARAALELGDEAGALKQIALLKPSRDEIADTALRTQYTAEIDELEGALFISREPTHAIDSLSSAMDIFGREGRPLRRAKLLLLRGRAHRAAGDRAAAERDWVEGAEMFEDQRPEIRDAQQQIGRFDQLWDLFRELMVARADNAVASLEVAERFRGRALLDALSNDRQSAPLAGDAMYRWLPARVAVVAYAVMPDQLFRWTITRDGVSLEPLKVDAKELARLVDRHRAAMSGRGDETDADSRRLASWLLPASLAPQRVTRVVFLPDGPLFGVPFATLPMPGDASHWLVDDFIPSVAPSLTVLKNAPQRTAVANALLISVGEANADEGLPALPGAAAEIAAIAPAYRGITRLSGAAATPAAILTAMPSANVMHFAGHAIADAADSRRSRLIASSASGADAVTFDDLRRTRLRPGAVVVLSACDGARGRVFHGEGAVGLTYPFLANGASAVVAALWQIDDATPVSLWHSFHSRVSAGAPPDAALAESQRMSRQSGAPPSAWAAFETIGGLSGQ